MTNADADGAAGALGEDGARAAAVEVAAAAKRAGAKRRALRRGGVLLAEAALGVVGAGAVAAGALCWRLAQGPLELPMLAPHVEAQLSALRGDRPIDIGAVHLVWSPERRSLEFRASDVRLLSVSGEEVSRSAEVMFGLDPAPLLIGRVALERAAFVGGAISISMAEDGSATIAFGPPGAPADIVFPAPPPGETWAERAERMLSGLEAAFGGLGAAASFKELTVEDVSLTVAHAGLEARWSAAGAALSITREGEALRLSLTAPLVADQRAPPVPARFSLTTDTAFKAAVAEARIENARLSALAPTRALGPLAALDAPATLTASAGLDRALGLTRVEGDLAFGRGALRLPEGAAPLDGGRLRGRYAHEDDALVIEEAVVSGARTRLRGAGRISGASALFAAAGAPRAPFAVELASAAIEAPGLLAGPVALTGLTVTGAFAPQARAIEVERAAFSVEHVSVALSGRVWWTPDGDGGLRPGLSVRGAASGALTPAGVLQFWPVTAAPTTRRWLSTAVRAGAIEDVRFSIEAPPEALRGPLPAEAVDVRFAFSDAQVAYLQGMDPITEAAGDARLTGQSFLLTLSRGRIGALTLSEGRVELPRFERGATHVYAAKAEGPARAMVDLLRQAPIGLDGRLPADPATITGHGVVDFAIRRPNRADLEAEELAFTVDGRLDGVGARAPDGMTLADWRLRVVGDERSLTFEGPLRLDGSPLDLRWTERLQGGGDARSTIVASGALDAAQITRMGFPIADYVSGRVGVDVRAVGEGLKAKTASVRLDLADSVVTFPLGYWTKLRGQPAAARFEATRDENGGFRLSGLSMDGPGLAVRGAAQFDARSALVEAQLEALEIEGRADARLGLQALPNGALGLDVRGRLFSLAPILGEGDPVNAAAAAGRRPGPVTAEMAETPRPAQPITGAISTDVLRLAGGADLKDGRVAFATNGEALTALSLQGADPADRPLSVAIAPQASGPARVRFEAQDAGFAWRALTGQENVIGGTADGSGTWNAGAGGAPSTGLITVRMRDFQVVKVPAMARLLSSVSSLQGLSDALNGAGIAFATLEAPVAYTDGEVRLNEARMAGPSLGLTARGTVDLEQGRLEIDGVVVPSYTLNSMIGAVPILGDLLTSRRGEGVVGITYSMRGPADDARVGVNPLSALTPGILRRIFEPAAAPQSRAEAGPTGG